ncbi:NepR family anti-sigma factor [Rhodovulum sp. YNF3179]|uniref:NepR family anti-sigma factor n=1 Tax=Rhodovulum sp. YNF3179 TaxID=3425127 RepID=UPI003D3577C3
MTNQRKKSKVQEQIDENLRRVYAEALDDEIPDRFTSLLDQLRAQEKGRATDDPAEGE